MNIVLDQYILIWAFNEILKMFVPDSIHAGTDKNIIQLVQSS